jgi:hypothetical protein
MTTMSETHAHKSHVAIHVGQPSPAALPIWTAGSTAPPSSTHGPVLVPRKGSAAPPASTGTTSFRLSPVAT